MKVRALHPWPASAAEAEEIQDRLRPLVITDTDGIDPLKLRRVCGLDVSYEKGTDRLAAAVVVLDAASLKVIESVSVLGRAAFPYVPGLFAFRELPALTDALERLTTTPDLLVCDGQGIAHPRRFGLACHVGVLTGLPSIGVAKQPLVGTYTPPDARRGSWSPLWDDGEVVGRALRTQTSVKPVFVSVGHRIGLDLASEVTLALCPSYRLPETTRHADHLSRQTLKTRE
jgi:deoxyribonuclease V